MAVLGSALLGSALLGGPLQVLQVAWGADLTDITGGSWVWTDVTAYARTDPGLTWRLGRNDESSKSNPAELTVVLDNTTEAFSLGGRSPNYPNVKRNVPVRLLIDPGDVTGARIAFLGFATGWTPSWDSLNGDIPVVTLTASGSLRRLGQGAEPVISPVKRFLTALEAVQAYWPCEVGKHAGDIPCAFGGGNITWAGTADLASCTDFPASLDLPKTNSSGLFRAVVTPYSVPANNTQSVRLMFSMPPTSSQPPDNTALVSLIMQGGTTSRIDLLYGTGDSLKLRAYDLNGATIATDGPTAFNTNAHPGMISLEFAQSGGTLFLAIKFLGLGSTIYGTSGGASGSGVLGNVSEIWIDAYQQTTGMGFGHLALLTSGSALDPLTDGYLQINAYDGEGITNGRLARVCAENNISLTLYGGTADAGTFNDAAGPQDIDTVLNIIHSCEDVERGVLWDGLTPGLAYTTRRRHENAAAGLTVDASLLQLAAPFEPTDDDQRTRNRWTVSRTNGAEFTVSDDTGPLGTLEIGRYSDSAEINSYQDRAARDLADWLVHAGTVWGYRYPALSIDLVANPELRAAVLDLFVGARVDVTNPGSALAAVPRETISLTVEGIQHDMTADHWTVKLSCSPFDVWRVATLAADAGDTGEFIERPDVDGSTLTTGYSAGATSVVVATPSGPLWTTTADDFPLDLSIGGVKVTASACTAPVVSGGAPTVSARGTGKNDTSATSHAVSMPGGYAVGDKLLVAFSNDIASVTASTSSTGWSSLITRSQGTASTAQLGQTADSASSSSSSANKTVVSTFTAASTGSVGAGHARLWVDTGTAPTVSMVIYADSSGVPGSLLGQSNTLTLSNTSEAQIDFTFATPVSITSGTPYWIGFTWPDPGTNNVFWSRAGTAGAASQNSLNAAASFGAATTLSGPIDAYVDVVTPATNHTCTVFTKTATGSDSLTVDLSTSVVGVSNSQKATWAIVAVNGWTSAPEATGNDGGSSTTATPVAITPSGGSNNYLGIEVISTDSSATTAQSITQSTGYTNVQSQNPGVTTSAATFTAEQTYTSTSTWTPSTVTLSVAEQWIAFTIAIKGAASTPTTNQTFTVAPLPVARSSGAAVAVWNPPVLGL